MIEWYDGSIVPPLLYRLPSLSMAKHGVGLNTSHKGQFAEFCIDNERRVVVLWMLKVRAISFASSTV